MSPPECTQRATDFPKGATHPRVIGVQAFHLNRRAFDKVHSSDGTPARCAEPATDRVIHSLLSRRRSEAIAGAVKT
jgi:hypothetical protein